jgi:hypothetical protein
MAKCYVMLPKGLSWFVPLDCLLPAVDVDQRTSGILLTRLVSIQLESRGGSLAIFPVHTFAICIA